MKTFEKWFEDNYNEKMPEGCISYEWFFKHDLPMVVHCTCCDSTMLLPNSIVAEDGYLYCPSCAEGCFEEEEE